MKKAELIDSLEGYTASELAYLAGVSLNRGRPSAALRAKLVANVLAEIKAKRITVRKDGTLVRKGA